ncbi:unnamed protein product [Boreogadus saida]
MSNKQPEALLGQVSGRLRRLGVDKAVPNPGQARWTAGPQGKARGWECLHPDGSAGPQESLGARAVKTGPRLLLPLLEAEGAERREARRRADGNNWCSALGAMGTTRLGLERHHGRPPSTHWVCGAESRKRRVDFSRGQLVGWFRY